MQPSSKILICMHAMHSCRHALSQHVSAYTDMACYAGWRVSATRSAQVASLCVLLTSRDMACLRLVLTRWAEHVVRIPSVSACIRQTQINNIKALCVREWRTLAQRQVAAREGRVETLTIYVTQRLASRSLCSWHKLARAVSSDTSRVRRLMFR
jgi:hypothetical protein